MKILMTGGSGLLGQELKPYFPKADIPTHKELDITKPIKTREKYNLIIHLAAHTDLVKAEKEERLECFETNVMGTYNLLRAFPQTPFVYMSSEYCRNPVNFYSHTKLIAEILVSTLTWPWLIIRTLFKPNPFPWDRAFVDQWTQGDYSNIIAPLVYKEIKEWDGKTNKLSWLGTGRKTMWELAKRTRPDVIPCSIEDIRGIVLPKDYE